MGFGPVTRVVIGVSDPAPEGAPQLTLVSGNGQFEYAVTHANDPDVVGSVLCYVEANSDGSDPTDGLSMDEIRNLEGVSEISLAGAPGEVDQGTETWPGGYEDGGTAYFACASTDDPDDLE